MTQAKWADTALARWIRHRMEAEGIPSKRALAERLAGELGISRDSAEQQVTRWTARETFTLSQESRAALRVILEEDPPIRRSEESLAPAVAELEAALVALAQRVERLTRRVRDLEQPAHPRKRRGVGT